MSNNEILDPQAIEALRGLSPEADSAFLHELIAIYLEDTPKQLAELQEALTRQDAAKVTRAAHTIKGSSGNFGAVEFARLAQEIEAQGKANNLTAAAAGLSGLKAHYALVVDALKRIDQGT
jgi:HPt (histidine-containing phosphotransfer) domain-containing protein